MRARRKRDLVVLALAACGLGSCISFDGVGEQFWRQMHCTAAELAMGTSPWSPDGRTLVVSALSDQPPGGLLLVAVDGSGMRALTSMSV